MIHRPIYLSCDSCGFERQPTPGESRETIDRAFRRAREEGWLIHTSGKTMICPHCLGGNTPPEDGIVGAQIVQLD